MTTAQEAAMQDTLGRRFGIPPRTAAEQLQHSRDSRDLGSSGFQPLPAPTGAPPFRLELASVLGTEPGALAFHVLGDSGGVKDPNPQRAVAAALAADHAARPVSFAYHVGDVVYFNGADAEYGPQLYEPYAERYGVPIFAIPGNHDGDPEGSESSLEAFMRYFCAPSPTLPSEWSEYQRDTMDQPNCYWTLRSAHITVVGLYSNVPSGGEIEEDQREWLAGELKAAPADVPLIVALHHPPYSVDAHHGGSARMGEVLDAAFAESGRCPNLVLAGHVHDAQFFARDFGGKQIGYVVIGNGGYHNLHALAGDAVPGTDIAPGVHYAYGDDSEWGFLRLEVSTDGSILGEYVGVARDGTVTPGKYRFSA